jgi:hypothetical protein
MAFRSVRGSIRRMGTGPPARVIPATVIGEIAARQHGIVSRSQLLERGVPSHVIDYAVAAGRFTFRHRGVYQVFPIAGARAGEMAAALACGPDARVSHWSAAALDGLTQDRLRGSAVHLLVPRTRGLPVPATRAGDRARPGGAVTDRAALSWRRRGMAAVRSPRMPRGTARRGARWRRERAAPSSRSCRGSAIAAPGNPNAHAP